MNGTDKPMEAPATTLCKACGLCCSGHLFAWVKLRSPEVNSARSRGLHVLGTDPKQRGFNQPCPLWNGECTIYNSPEYPRACKTYQCKLLKRLLDGSTALPDAIRVVQTTKTKIRFVAALLPDSSNCNFRERLIAHLEAGTSSAIFQRQAYALLQTFEDEFGVKDIIEHPEEL